MKSIEIFSPSQFIIPGGPEPKNIKRTILILESEFNGEDILISFLPRDKALFMDFLEVCRTKIKVTGRYTIHLVDLNKWIQCSIMSDIGNNTILIEQPVPGGQFAGGNYVEV